MQFILVTFSQVQGKSAMLSQTGTEWLIKSRPLIGNSCDVLTEHINSPCLFQYNIKKPPDYIKSLPWDNGNHLISNNPCSGSSMPIQCLRSKSCAIGKTRIKISIYNCIYRRRLYFLQPFILYCFAFVILNPMFRCDLAVFL